MIRKSPVKISSIMCIWGRVDGAVSITLKLSSSWPSEATITDRGLAVLAADDARFTVAACLWSPVAGLMARALRSALPSHGLQRQARCDRNQPGVSLTSHLVDYRHTWLVSEARWQGWWHAPWGRRYRRDAGYLPVTWNRKDIASLRHVSPQTCWLSRDLTQNNRHIILWEEHGRTHLNTYNTSTQNICAKSITHISP